LRARTSGELSLGDDGFTLIELIVAITMLAVTLMVIAYGLYGGMSVLQNSRHKTAFFELANAEAELMRSLPYGDVGVYSDDPDRASAYPGDKHPQHLRDAVVLTPPASSLPRKAPEAVTRVTTSGTLGLPAPYTIQRWVTWTDPQGGSTQLFKRLDIRISWQEVGGANRVVDYTTLYYPGDIGPPVPTDRPIAKFTVAVQAPLHPMNGGIATWAGIVGETFALNAADSTGASSYQWDFGNNSPPAAGLNSSVSYSAPGAYTITLVVKNAAGVASEPAAKTVLVGNDKPDPLAGPGNTLPRASFFGTSQTPDTPTDPSVTQEYKSVDYPGGTPLKGAAPFTVVVDASGTTDEDGDGLLYIWNWGDGTSGRGAGASHVYQSTGIRTLELIVKDPRGGISKAWIEVFVDGVRCSIDSARFENPFPNTVPPPRFNFIRLKGPRQSNNDKKNTPDQTGFQFTAVTNSPCTAVTVNLPLASGATFTLSLLKDGPLVSGKQTWVRATAITSGFNAGTSQSGFFSANGPITNPIFDITFGADY